MAHLLHIDSSIQGDRSVSRKLSAAAAAQWRATHPAGTVTYRDLAAQPLPHLSSAEHRESLALSAELIDELKEADAVLLGLPMYNFGAPSTIHCWVDHIVAPGLSFDAETGSSLLGDVDFVVLASRGGGYDKGTPREGWDHAQAWLPHAVSMIGLSPRFITAELTMAEVNPAMADLKPLAAASLARATAEIDGLWSAGEHAA
jgi:FMN-dependent NADH-azoreductase